jgi:hypothetical protein
VRSAQNCTAHNINRRFRIPPENATPDRKIRCPLWIVPLVYYFNGQSDDTAGAKQENGEIVIEGMNR